MVLIEVSAFVGLACLSAFRQVTNKPCKIKGVIAAGRQLEAPDSTSKIKLAAFGLYNPDYKSCHL